MKKIIVALLLTALTTVSMAGCGSTASQDTSNENGQNEEVAAESADGAVTLTLLSWYSEEQLGSFIDDFETENPDIKIDLQYVPPVQQYVDKFSVLIASDQMTDMFYTAAENKQDVIEKGLAEDLSDMEVFSRIDPATAATYGNNGEVYAYSPDAWIGGVFYNKALFEQAGITKEPETWDEFVEDCKILKAAGIEPYMDDADNVHNLAQDLYQSSVISKTPDADQLINDGSGTFVEYYAAPLNTWYEDMIASELYSQASLGMNSDQILDAFANEQIAMFHGGPWNVTTIEEKNPELAYDIFGISDKEGNQVLPGAVNVGLSISTSSAHKDQCRKFIEFMSKDENIVKWQQITNNAIIVDGIDYEMGTVFEKFKEDAVNGNFYLPQIAWKNSAGIYKEFLSSIQDVITGAGTVEEVSVRLDEKQAELSK